MKNYGTQGFHIDYIKSDLKMPGIRPLCIHREPDTETELARILGTTPAISSLLCRRISCCLCIVVRLNDGNGSDATVRMCVWRLNRDRLLRG